jgi:hypothetical protein
MMCLISCGGSGGGGGGGSGNPPPAAPAISYGATNFSITAQSPVTLTPTNSGGAVASWSISAGLPVGLSFNTSTGVISGTVSGPLAPSTATITAKNAGGSSSVELTIGAQSALVTLGVLNVGQIAVSASNVLAMEPPYGRQHWVLWDYASGATVAQGDGCPATPASGFSKCGTDAVAVANVALAGAIAVVPYTPGAIEILSAANGDVVGTIKGTLFYHFQVAPDASYVCTVDNNALTAWATNGAAIVSHAGSIANASVSCAVGEMRIANGPAGASVIERVALPGGQTTVSAPFAGTFSAWFADGSAFLTSVGTTVWVYSPSGTLLDTRTLATTANLGGTGQWFWTFDGTTLSIYKVGASATPAAVYAVAANTLDTFFAVSASTLTLWDTAAHIIDLSGNVPVKTDYPIVPLDRGTWHFAAASAQQWVVGTDNGAILDGGTLANLPPRFFSYGSVTSLAGSATRLAAATASGQTLVYDTSNWSLVTTLQQGLLVKVQISDAGTVLATLGGEAFGSRQSPVQTISLPAGTLINTWNYNWDVGPAASDITLSGSGLLLGQVIGPTGVVAGSRQVTAASGGPVLWSDSGATSPIYLSGDDKMIAVAAGSVTNIYLNDQLSTQLPGSAVGWVTNDEILQYTNGHSVVYSTSGAPVGGPSLPPLGPTIQVVTSDSIYDAASNAIYSLSTAAKTWSGPPTPGVLAGSRIAYVSGNQLVTEPY